MTLYRNGLLSALLVLSVASGSALAQSEGRIVGALSSDVPSLDASVDSSPIGYNVRLNIYDQLTEVAGNGSVTPRLATHWEASPDSTSWVFTIRTGTKFHNGAPVTIDDVIWTFQKILADSRAPVRTFISKVKNIEKVAEDKVRFELTEPFGLFERNVSMVSIQPRAAYEAMGAAQFGVTPIGSGPYRLVRWVKDDRIELEAFPDYWAGAPKLKSAVLRPVPSDSARAAALLSRELDIVPALPPPLVERLGSRPGVKVEKADGAKTVFLGFNTGHPALANLKLRRAIDHAIDREAITGRLLRGLGKPSGQVVAPMFFGYDPKIEPTTYDVARAKALVQESGYNGEPIPFQFPTTFITSSTEVAQAVAGYLDAVGIKVEPTAMEWNAFFPVWTARRVSGMYLFAFGSTLLDSDATLTGLYEAGSRGYWLDPTVDSLAKQQRATSDPARRRELISQVWRMSKDNAAYVVLYSEVQAYGLGQNVNWSPWPDGVLRLWHISPPGPRS